ncbi:hypothetical protein D3C85_943680 [compost metagenome]
MVGLGQPGLGHHLVQLGLDLVRRRGVGQTQPMRDAKHVGVHRNGRLNAQFVQHHAGGLAPHAGQGLQVGAVQRHLAAVLLDQHPGGGDDVPRLGAIEADGGNQRDQPLLAQGQHLLRRVGDGEQGLGRLVDPHVGRLGRQGDGHDQGVGIDEIQLGLGIGHDPRQAHEDFLDPILVRRPADHGPDRRLLRRARPLARRRAEGGADGLGGGTFADGHVPASPSRRAASTGRRRHGATKSRRRPLISGRSCPFYAPKSKRAVSPWPSPPLSRNACP